MLGVDPAAGIDEIRAAYRARARAAHPDHRDGPDPVADAEMAAINAAWATLRQPDVRAAYDRSLVEPGAREPGSARGVRRASWDPPPVHQEAPGCLTTLAGVGPWIAVLVMLAAIFVFTAYAGGDGDDSHGPPVDDTSTPTVRVRDLRGSCIGLANGATIVVDCFTVPHEGVIVAQASLGAACPDGTVEWVIRQQQVLACTQPGTEARP